MLKRMKLSGIGGLGVLVAILFWIAEALLHALVFGGDSFLDNLFFSDPNENWMRLLISVTVIAFGFYAQAAVDQQQELQETIRKKGARLQKVIDGCYDAYVSMDQEGQIIDWNRSAEVLFGWPRQKVIGKSMEIIIPERLREDHRKGMARYQKTNIGSFLYQPVSTHALHRDGFEFPIEIVVTPLKSDGPLEYFAFIRENFPESK